MRPPGPGRTAAAGADRNASSALGYAQGWALWVLLAAAGVLLIPVYARRLRAAGTVAALAAGLQLGGAVGNLLDRLVLGGATDMLTLGRGLAWNLADISLATGTVLATALLLRTWQQTAAPGGRAQSMAPRN